MKPTTVKLAALALFYLSRNASNPCYDTGCFLGVCKYTPPSGEPQRQDWPIYHGVSFILSLTGSPHLNTEGNTKMRPLYKNNHLHGAGLAFFPFCAAVPDDFLVPSALPLHWQIVAAQAKHVLMWKMKVLLQSEWLGLLPPPLPSQSSWGARS